MTEHESITREELAAAQQWGSLPVSLQGALWQHYLSRAQESTPHQARMDCLSAADTLQHALHGERIEACLAEHERHFGERSARWLRDMINASIA